MVALVPTTDSSRYPSRYTSYCVTPTLSDDAFQVRLKSVPAMFVADRPVGAVGDCVSKVVTLSALLADDVLPAASFAIIVTL